MSEFTGFLARIAKIAGESAATRLALAAGGTEMKFSPHPRSALAKIVGAEAAKKIVSEMGPEKYTIPMAHLRGRKGRQVQAAQMAATGNFSASQIAKTCDVHERTVWRVKKSLQDEAELPLFDRLEDEKS